MSSPQRYTEMVQQGPIYQTGQFTVGLARDSELDSDLIRVRATDSSPDLHWWSYEVDICGETFQFSVSRPMTGIAKPKGEWNLSVDGQSEKIKGVSTPGQAFEEALSRFCGGRIVPR